jgi:uncharacterized protein (TIGR01777 family)
MRVVIVGGDGLVGRALAADLAGDGAEAIILSRSPGPLDASPAGVSTRHWDGRTGDGWEPLVDGAVAIVNLAGESISSSRWTLERKYAILQSRLEAGRAVVRAVAAASHRPAVVIQASGVGYYGPRGNEEIAEESPTGQGFLARAVLDWESSTAPVEAVGVRRVTIRTGVVLTEQGGALARMLRQSRFFLGRRMGSGAQWFPWIHIADQVAAIRFLIENEHASGPFNLTAPVPITNAEFSRLLRKQLRRPMLLPMPRVALRVMFGEMATILLDGQRAIPSGLLRLGFAFQFRDASLALADLLSPPRT